jgi:hypothetical protein
MEDLYMAPMMAHLCWSLSDRASAQLPLLWCIGAGAALLSSSHRPPASTGAAASMLNPNW